MFIVGEIEHFPNVSARGAINWFAVLSGPNLLVFSKNQNSHGRRVRGTDKMGEGELGGMGFQLQN